MHFVPGGSERMFQKALTLPADALILDLEDSVTPDRKSDARRQVCEWLAGTDFGDQECLVRINPLDGDWGRDDLEAIMRCPHDGIVVPKVSGPGDVDAIDRLLNAMEAGGGLAPGSTSIILIGTETPGSVFEMHHTARHPRVSGFAWAAEDLSAALGTGATRDATGDYLEVFGVVRSLALLAAAAAGVQPIDGPFVNLKDEAGLRRECERTAAMGYTGKLTIHPAQIEIVNEAFAPSAAEVERAAALLQAFRDNLADGCVAFTFEGEMVDVPHRKRALALLRRAGIELPED